MKMRTAILSILISCGIAIGCHGAVNVTASRTYVDSRTSLVPVTNNSAVVGFKLGIHTNSSEVLASRAYVDSSTPGNYQTVSNLAMNVGPAATNYTDIAIRAAAPSPKRIAMFLLPINDIFNDGYFDGQNAARWIGFDLKASTNNFSSYLYGCNSAYLENHVGDSATILVPGIGNDMEIWPYDMTQSMQLFNITTSNATEVAEMLDVRDTIVVLVSTNDCRMSDGKWLAENNDELTWIWLRINDGGIERYGRGTYGPVWRPITPVRWFSEMPTWAR